VPFIHVIIYNVLQVLQLYVSLSPRGYLHWLLVAENFVKHGIRQLHLYVNLYIVKQLGNPWDYYLQRRKNVHAENSVHTKGAGPNFTDQLIEKLISLPIENPVKNLSVTGFSSHIYPFMFRKTWHDIGPQSIDDVGLCPIHLGTTLNYT
jgi:hypothetical protein